MTTELLKQPYKLYNTLSVIISSICLPIGGYLIAINYNRTGDKRKRNIAILLTTLLSISEIITSFLVLFMDAEVVVAILILSLSSFYFILILIYLLHSQLQGEMIREHINKGGKMESTLKAFLALFLSIAVCSALGYFIDPELQLLDN
ncbi:hypothetical protein ZL58_23505 [Salmonella enterica subsp. enterica serovar Typhimurium]|nr:hypothetical protein [Salmonella enterica subsp. enterica serovar Typhimurium]